MWLVVVQSAHGPNSSITPNVRISLADDVIDTETEAGQEPLYSPKQHVVVQLPAIINGEQLASIIPPKQEKPKESKLIFWHGYILRLVTFWKQCFLMATYL